MKTVRGISKIVLSLGLLVFSYSSMAEEKTMTTAETLLSRIQVEDFINDYYWELASGAGGELSLFWTEDAVFDVNGEMINGLAAIEEVYSLGLGPGGKLVFQSDMPRIRIDGNKATVDLIYTGVLNVDPEKAPVLYEQGHDHMELINTDGDWKIRSRVLRSYSLDQSGEE